MNRIDNTDAKNINALSSITASLQQSEQVKGKKTTLLPPLSGDMQRGILNQTSSLGMAPPNTSFSHAQLNQMTADIVSMRGLAFNIEDIAAVMFEALMQSIRSVGLARITDAEAQESERFEAADKMRNEASERLGGAIVGASMSITAAGISLGGVGYTAKSGVTDPIAVQNSMLPFSNIGAVTQESGKIISSSTDYQAGLDSAAAAEIQAGAEETGALKESDSETYQELMKLLDQIMQIIQQKIQSDHDAGSRIMPA